LIKIENSVFEDRQYIKTLTKINDLDLHITDAYRISRLIKKLDELSTEYGELKKILTNKYGTIDGDGVKIEKENVEAFSEEYGELLKIEHDLEMELLSIPKSMEESVSSSDLNIIEKFFDLSSLN
jgi:hypothetical protein